MTTNNQVGYIMVNRPPTVGASPEERDIHQKHMRARVNSNEYLTKPNNIPQSMGGIILDYAGKRLYTLPNLASFPPYGRQKGYTINDQRILLATHSSHSFVSTVYASKRIYLTGCFDSDGKTYYVQVPIEYGEDVYSKWHPIMESNITTSPLKMVYRSLEPREIFICTPERTKEIIENGVKMSEFGSKAPHPIDEAVGTVYISNYTEENGKAKFAFAFYGDVGNDYVGIDDKPRGSLTPNYKALLAGYGIITDQERKLIFSFKYKERHYVFRYLIDGKPDIFKGYHVSTNDANTYKIIEESPADYIVGEGTPKPVFTIESNGTWKPTTENNTITDGSKDKQKKKIITVESEEDAARFFAPQTHVKERPEPVKPDEGTVNKKLVLLRTEEFLSQLRAESTDAISYIRNGDRSIEINILKRSKPNSPIILRLVCNKVAVSTQYKKADGTWQEIKRFDASGQGKAIGNIVKVIRKNAEFPEIKEIEE